MDPIIEAKEHNLKLYNESIRKDLDIVLTSTIPMQKNLMKTLLWINTSVIGFSIAAIKGNIAVLYISLPFSTSFLAVLLILVSLRSGRLKAFGTPKLNDINSITPSRWLKVQGLNNINSSLKNAFDHNSKIVNSRGKKIADATNLTIASIVFIFAISIIYVNSNLSKGGTKWQMTNPNQMIIVTNQNQQLQSTLK